VEADFRGAGSDRPQLTELPQSRNAEGIEQDLVADQGQPLDLRLGNQHPVKRVPVCAGHQAGPPGVVDADRKMEKVLGKV
jgi:hypothetical protein